MSVVDVLAERLGRADAVDGVATTVSGVVGRVTHRPPLSSALSGTWLGHPLHPVLTDVPIGCWTSAFVLDLLPGRSAARAAQTVVGLGVLAALPTAATGASDWADTVGASRRIGLFHGLLNASALACYALSWRRRRRGHHAGGVVLAMTGATFATVAASLGRHLVYRLGNGVDVNAFDVPPADWTAPDGDPEPLHGADGVHLRTGSAGVLATRREGGRWRGIGSRCSHRGGPLDEGRFGDDCVTCPWHQSRFDLADGTIVDGPATAPQPRYEVRETDGRFEVRGADTP